MLRLITRDGLSSALMAAERGRRRANLVVVVVAGRESLVALRPWKEMLDGVSCLVPWRVVVEEKREIDEAEDAIFWDLENSTRMNKQRYGIWDFED